MNHCKKKNLKNPQRDSCLCVHRVGSGHYTAYGSHESRWYHFNDSTVTLTNEETVKKAKAYILFYIERTGQVALEKVPTDNTATTRPDLDTPATDCISPDIISQDEVAGEAEMVLMAGAATQESILDEKSEEDVSISTAPIKEEATVSDEAAADRDTSEQSGTEEALQTAVIQSEFTASQ